MTRHSSHYVDVGLCSTKAIQYKSTPQICLGDTYQGALRSVACVGLVVRVVDEVLRRQRRSFIAETHRYRPGRRLVD